MSYTSSEPIYLLTLLNLPNIGHKTLQYILYEFKVRDIDLKKMSKIGDIRQLFRDIAPDMQAKYTHSRFYIPELYELEKAYYTAKDIVKKCTDLGVQIIPYYDDKYPQMLKKIDDPPVILYVKGNYEYINNNSIAVVGTRTPTEYGIDAATKVSQYLSRNNLIVVSGLAEGIDTAAHKGCLDVNGRTIAVLAHGHDKIYPIKNKGLVKRILDEDGCIISEYPPGMSFSSGNFIQRDRIQSGLCSGIIVIESDIGGGTMHTVSYCLKQHRYLGCIKHPEQFLEYRQTKGNQVILDTDILVKNKKKMKPELYRLIQQNRKLIFCIEPEDEHSIDIYIRNTRQILPPTTNITNIFNHVEINIYGGNVTIPITPNDTSILVNNINEKTIGKKRKAAKKKELTEDQTRLKNIFENN